MSDDSDTPRDGAQRLDHGGAQLADSCEMPDCESTDDLKACRDPEGNLLDMCPDCRGSWPVTVVEA